MKLSLTGALIVLAVVLFFLGRFTAPVKTVEDTRKIDSLTRDIARSNDSLNHYRILSNTWFQKAMDAQRIKAVTRTIYTHDTIRINTFTDAQLDSAFRARYPLN